MMSKTSTYFYIVFILILALGCRTEDKKFQELANPTTSGSQYPHLFVADGSLFMSWLSTDQETFSLHTASYSNGHWSPVDTIAQSDHWFVNWADFPSVIAHPEGAVAAHWLNKKPGGTYAYDVNIAFHRNGEWTSPLIPHSDSTATEHGFVSMIPWDTDTILAVWLDGRQSADRQEDDYYNLDYAMTLRGALISNTGSVEEEFLIDSSVCDCCQTALVKTPEGAIVAYRNRTEEEIRDIYISRFDGSRWSKSQPVHTDGWEIGACPVNGPSITLNDSLAAIAWHTSANDKPMVKAVLSTDGGASFSEPFTISEQPSMGRVDVAIHNNQTYISWLAKKDSSAALNLRAIDENQRLSDVLTVDDVSASRKGGFPQLAILNDTIILARTTVSDALPPSVEMKSKALPLFPN